MVPAAYLSTPLLVLLAGCETYVDRMSSLLPVGCMMLLLVRCRRGSGRISASLYLCIQSLFLLGEWLGPEQVPTAALLSMAAITLAYRSWNDRICAYDLRNLVAITAVSWFVACNQNTYGLWEAVLLHLALTALDILAEDTFFQAGTHAIVGRKQKIFQNHVAWFAEFRRRQYDLIFVYEPVSEPTQGHHPEAAP